MDPADPPTNPAGPTEPQAESAATPSEPTPETEHGLLWKRPHPITIVIEIGNALRSFIFAIVAVQGGFFDASGSIEMAVIAAPLAAGLARWYTTRYALGTESIYHQYGLIRRHKQVLPRTNVQNVSTRAGLVARMGSVVELQISDASANGDIKLRLISRDEADRLTTLLRSSMVAPDPDPADPTASHPDPDPSGLTAPDPTAAPTGSLAPTPTPTPHPDASAPSGRPVDTPPLVAPTFGAIARAELTSSPIVIILISSVALACAMGIALTRQTSFVPVDNWLLIVAAGAAPLILAAPGVLPNLFAFGGFRLDADPDRLRIRAGLITEAGVAARRERLQQIQVDRDPLHRLQGIERIRYETADVEDVATRATRYLSPTSPTDEWKTLAVEALGEVQLDEADLAPVSPLIVRRTRIRFALTIPLIAIGTFLVHPYLAIAATAAWMAFGWWYGARRFALVGVAVSNDQLLVRRGVVHQQLVLVRLDKIQSLRTTASPTQQWLDLAALTVSTAGQSRRPVTVPDLPARRAAELLEALATRASITPISETL